jgi:hypothetical protein
MPREAIQILRSVGCSDPTAGHACKKIERLRSTDRKELSMTASRLATSTIVALGALTALSIGAGRPSVVPPVSAAAQETDTSTLDDQVDLAVTVYNSDLALVRDTRSLQLARGIHDLHFMDIAATVNPASVHFRSITEPSRLSVLEQNYEYDLLEPDKLLRKYVGRDVTLVRSRTDGGVSRDEEVRARLLSYNTAPVWRIDNEIVTGFPADHIRFPELPGNLYSRPTLIWTLDNRGGAQQRVEASYLATRLSWSADYVLTVARDDRSADLDGWVTVVNGSGTSFRNAKLQLVAGDLNRVRPLFDNAVRREMQAKAADAPAPAMAQEPFSDYHLYSLERKTSINDKETKQVSMLSATSFPVRKRYVVDGQSYYYRSPHPGAALKDAVQILYTLTNEAKSGLGMPMPAGTVRVYQADSSGSVQFVGEDRIDHTPKDEALDLKIGNAFDVTCERRQTDFERIASNVFELEYEIVLKNHKTSPLTVELNEPIGGTWRMVRASHTWTKTSAWAAQFAVPLNPDGATTVTYRVRVTY